MENGRANLIMTPEYKAWFKNNKPLHGKESLGELLDEAVYKLMVDTDSYKAYTLKIEQLEKELKETKVLRKSLPSIIVPDSDITTKSLLNNIRLALFDVYKVEISKRNKSNTLSMLDLKRFVLDGSFKDKKEVIEAMREYAKDYPCIEKTVKIEFKTTNLSGKQIEYRRQQVWIVWGKEIKKAISSGTEVSEIKNIDMFAQNALFDDNEEMSAWIQVQFQE